MILFRDRTRHARGCLCWSACLDDRPRAASCSSPSLPPTTLPPPSTDLDSGTSMPGCKNVTLRAAAGSYQSLFFVRRPLPGPAPQASFFRPPTMCWPNVDVSLIDIRIRHKLPENPSKHNIVYPPISESNTRSLNLA